MSGYQGVLYLKTFIYLIILAITCKNLYIFLTSISFFMLGKFNWGSVIKQVLKKAPDNELPVKKLRKKVIRII